MVESLNNGYINQNNAYVDQHGYLRWKDTNKLCHRDIAYNQIFKNGNFKKKFSDYDVHHKDGNKFNCRKENLEILDRDAHEKTHGKLIIVGGRRYIRLVRENRHRKQTRKAILIGGRRGKWYPKSQLISQNGYLYATEWIVKKKGDRQ